MNKSGPTNNGIQLVKEVETTFDDVAGAIATKEELQEVVQFLKHPDRFRSVGAKVPKGVLMEGPPGTGKTLLARAVAGESGTAFLSVSASSFVEMYVGLGAARVRALFEEAKKQAPCILWIDEIDAVGRKRGGSGIGAGNEERETTLNELLACMDGFDASSGVVVLAATNRADVLDEALVRSGRFDRRVSVALPTCKERRQILDVHARGKTLDNSDDLNSIAACTPGFSGADLSNLMNEAVIRAIRRNSTSVNVVDLEGALDRVTMGLPREDDDSISNSTRERVAIHEAGHAVVATVLGYDTISRVSIVPRSAGAGGFTAFVPDEDRSVGGIYTLHYLKMRLAVLLGGRAAEEVVLGRDTITTGASSDLERVETTARRMVSEWGFGSTLVAPGSSKVFGGDAGNTFDRDIDELVNEAYDTALSIVNGNLLPIRDVSKLLLKERTIDGKSVKRIVDAYLGS
jgi:cell division protease FtsH